MWRGFFRSKRDQGLEDEIESHLNMATTDRTKREKMSVMHTIPREASSAMWIDQGR